MILMDLLELVMVVEHSRNNWSAIPFRPYSNTRECLKSLFCFFCVALVVNRSDTLKEQYHWVTCTEVVVIEWFLPNNLSLL